MWQNRNTEDALWGLGVGSTLLRSTIFGKNSILLRINLLEKVILDKIEKGNILKRVVI